MQDDHRHIPVEIKLPAKYAKGGLATAAKDVASAGEGGDTMLVHVNKAEFEMLRKQWGDPQINDKTGLPSYSWGDWLGPLAGVIGGVTGIGGDLGGAITGALGADVSPAVSSALGSALIGGGLGALGGGGRGALYGGLAGGAAGYLGGGNNMLSGLFGGGAGALSSGASSILDDPLGNNSAGFTGAVQGPTTSGATLDAASKAGGGSSGLGALLSGNTKYGYTPLLMAGLVAANAFGQNRGPSADSKAAAANTAAAQAKFNAPLPVTNFNRTLLPLQGDPRKYGFGPTQQRFTGNGFGYAHGGSVAPRGALAAPAGLSNQQRLVQGPGSGRSDDIPARLSDSEYVIDAESVGMLGDGSPKAGAAKLDAMRANLRKHKGGALAQGQISPSALSPEQYMAGGRKL